MHLIKGCFVSEWHTTSIWKSMWEKELSCHAGHEKVSRCSTSTTLVPSFSGDEACTSVSHRQWLLLKTLQIKMFNLFCNLDLGRRGPENRTENNCNHRYGDFGEDFFRSRYNKLEVTMITNDDWRNWRGILANYSAGQCLSVMFIHTGRVQLKDWYRFHEILLAVNISVQFHTSHIVLGLDVGLGLGHCQGTITVIHIV